MKTFTAKLSDGSEKTYKAYDKFDAVNQIYAWVEMTRLLCGCITLKVVEVTEVL